MYKARLTKHTRIIINFIHTAFDFDIRNIRKKFRNKFFKAATRYK